MSFRLPKLPYAYDALEPYIDTMTMEIHHGKHHAAYVNNLNAALESHADLQGKSLEELLSTIRGLPSSIQNAVRNNGGGHFNHSLFWTVMGPNKGGTPSGDLADAINSTFGSFDKLNKFIRFSSTSQKIIIFSFIISFLYNIIGISFAVQGTLSPLISAILMPLSSISIVVFTTVATNFFAWRKGL